MVALPHLQIVLLLFLLNPVQRLLLWINTQWIPAGLCGQDTILDGQFIRGEPFRRPTTDLYIISKERVQLEGLTHGDVPVEDILLPLPPEHVPPEVPSKGPKVAKESRGQEAVAQQTDPLSFQLLKIFSPSEKKYKLFTFCTRKLQIVVFVTFQFLYNELTLGNHTRQKKFLLCRHI